MAASAPEIQCRWRCPAAGYRMHDSADELDEECRAVLASVGRIVKADELPPTCPLFAGRLNWVQRAMDARVWREHGELKTVEPDVSMTLVDAIRELDSAFAERHALEMKRLQQQRDKNEPEARD